MAESSMHYYVLNLVYVRPLPEVEALVDVHSKYIEAAYERGDFLLSGRKVPWNGGIIIARASGQAAIQAIIAEDPFLKEEVATYEVIEFNPTRSSADLATIMSK
jgi:uncharacterized protein YciI